VVADAPAYARQGIVLPDDIKGLVESGGCSERQIGLDVHAERAAYPARCGLALIQIKGTGRAICRCSSQGRMTRILKGTHIHTAPASRAQVVVYIYGVLSDDGPITIGTPLDGLDACMG
jgi:hypothetical protein